MAIYKLKELFSKKPEYGIGLKAKKEGKYAYVRQSDIGGSNFQYKVNRGPILKYNDILISRAGAYSGKSYIHKIRDENHVFAGFLVRYSFVNEVDNDYFYLWTKTKNYTDQVLLLARSGSTMPKLNPPVFSEMVINLPPLKQQKAIIEIIKPIKSLFLKYPKMIRIDNIEKTRIDIKNIIEIIKPFGDIVNNIDKEINLLKNLLISTYNSSDNSLYSLSKYILLNSNKYENQEYYNPTSSVGELRIDNSKIMKISSNRKSRANLTPVKNSFIVSKLLGENKVLFIDNCFDNVVSTGFFNFTTDHYDHLLGFILSEGFKKQKELNSTGTTMLGLTNESFLNLKIKAPVSNGSDVSIYISKLISIRSQAEKVVSLMTDILVK